MEAIVESKVVENETFGKRAKSVKDLDPLPEVIDLPDEDLEALDKLLDLDMAKVHQKKGDPSDSNEIVTETP